MAKAGKFWSFMRRIAGEKIEIKSVTAARENENCVVTLSVDWDKKGRFGKNPCRN
jgi:hypothetical protein